MENEFELNVVEDHPSEHGIEQQFHSGNLHSYRKYLGNKYKSTGGGHRRLYFYVMDIEPGAQHVSAFVTEGHLGDARYTTLGVEHDKTKNRVRIGFEILWDKHNANRDLPAFADVLVVK
jgi:hypothetical protein